MRSYIKLILEDLLILLGILFLGAIVIAALTDFSFSNSAWFKKFYQKTEKLQPDSQNYETAQQVSLTPKFGSQPTPEEVLKQQEYLLNQRLFNTKTKKSRLNRMTSKRNLPQNVIQQGDNAQQPISQKTPEEALQEVEALLSKKLATISNLTTGSIQITMNPEPNLAPPEQAAPLQAVNQKTPEELLLERKNLLSQQLAAIFNLATGSIEIIIKPQPGLTPIEQALPQQAVEQTPIEKASLEQKNFQSQQLATFSSPATASVPMPVNPQLNLKPIEEAISSQTKSPEEFLLEQKNLLNQKLATFFNLSTDSIPITLMPLFNLASSTQVLSSQTVNQKPPEELILGQEKLLNQQLATVSHLATELGYVILQPGLATSTTSNSR